MTKRQDNAQEKIVDGLTGLLADTYVLYNSTQRCHWNVEGPEFHALHQMFEEQYRELADAIDMIAERVRSLGFYTRGSLADVREHTRIHPRATLRDARDMLGFLIEGHQQIAHRLRELQGVAEDAMDQGTLDLLIERLRVHEKTIWMLKSQAGHSSEELSERPSLSASA